MIYIKFEQHKFFYSDDIYNFVSNNFIYLFTYFILLFFGDIR